MRIYMINTYINKYFFYLYAFTLCFGVLFYNTTGFKGLDVVSSLALIVLYLFFIIGTKNKSFHIGFFIVILIFLFYLNYSFYIANNSLNAITIDFLTQLRPYVAFFLVLQMSPSFTEKQKTILKKICFYLWLFYIPIGLLATINSSFLTSMMEQPSNYITCITCLAIIYLFCSNFTVKDKLTFIFMLSAGLIAIESRFYIFFLIVCSLLMFFHHVDVLKNNLKTGLALTVIVCIIVYISRAEILNYLFSAGITGGGFASLATQTSSGFYAQLNNSGFNPVNGFFYQEWFTGSASYYPFLAQLGVIGIFLYVSFWIYIITSSIVQFKQKNDIQPFVLVLLLTVFIFVENISDSFFTSNKGYFVMMFIGLLMGKPEDAENMVIFSDKKANKKKRFAALQAVWFIRKKSMTNTNRAQVAKEITYIIPPVPVKKIATADVKENKHIDVIQDVAIVQNEVKVTNIDTPKEVEMLYSVPEQNKSTIETINDTQNENITTIPLPVDITSEMIMADTEDEYEWEDDFEDDDNYDWESDFEKEVIMASEPKIEKVSEEEVVTTAALVDEVVPEAVEKEAEKVMLVYNDSQRSATDTPAQMNTMANQFNQSVVTMENKAAFFAEEYLLKNTTSVEEEISDDNFADGSYNYMI